MELDQHIRRRMGLHSLALQLPTRNENVGDALRLYSAKGDQMRARYLFLGPIVIGVKDKSDIGASLVNDALVEFLRIEHIERRCQRVKQRLELE